MVVAGPGTGKTELLSVRVANILAKTDTLPGTILCLTFTDSGAAAMRERLAELLGPDAYKVAVHTFHSFGSEIIGRYGEYFYSGAHFRPADELSGYEVLSDLMQKLPHDNPLASSMNGEFTYLKDVQTSISELKRGGLTSDELDNVLERNEAFITWAQPRLQAAFGERLSKKSFAAIDSLLHELPSYQPEPLELIGYIPLNELVSESLRRAYDHSLETNTTKPLSAWKKMYLERNAADEQTLKDEKRGRKLRALSRLYYEYLVAMQEHALYDYDDMILRVVHALEVFPELRFNLQETYQYILVDEFQDTNDAQMRLVWNLTNNPATEGRPNLMVVGDDDQAIYRFQGANLSNILDFTKRYRDVKIVTLSDNYRSHAHILQLARQVIVQAEERLETTVATIDKTLTAHRKSQAPRLLSQQYQTTNEAYYALAHTIASEVASEPSLSRAVIARNHRQLSALLPYLEQAGVPLRYERQENILTSEPIQQLELLARTVHSLSHEQWGEADETLSRLLAHPMWGLSAEQLWRLSLDSSRSKRTWLEVMQERDGQLSHIAAWIVELIRQSQYEPLEFMLDEMFGTETRQLPDDPTTDDLPFGENGQQPEFVSPMYQYFFNQTVFEQRSAAYLTHLAALQRIRALLREYRPDLTLKVCDLIAFLDLHHELGMPIRSKGELETGTHALHLLSAHKAKGLEFDAVYVADVQENIWGVSARTRGRLLQFPTNLPLSPAGEHNDERLRLLYVALTRARDQLTLVSSRLDSNGKELLLAGALDLPELTTHTEPPLPTAAVVTAQEIAWHTPLLHISSASQRELLQPTLERYRLSATHLTNYLDVSRGGPELFLLHNLLRFPQAMSPSAAFGSAIHTSLQRAHQHLRATKNRKPVEDVLHEFETVLRQSQLSELDFTHYHERGVSALTAFLEQRYESFTPKQEVERTFATEYIQVGDALLAGAIDLLDVDHDEKTIFVTDYKTGKSARRWQGSSEYEKIKLHHYEQQLLFYKLLIEHSRQFAGYTVTGARIEFVEPDASGAIVLLDYQYDNDKLVTFSHLLAAVWRRVMELDFSLPTSYETSLKGIQQFEQDILSNATLETK